VADRFRVASIVTEASGVERTSSAGINGSPGWDNSNRPSARRYWGGSTRTTVA
jgi:hypothetical protein